MDQAKARLWNMIGLFLLVFIVFLVFATVAVSGWRSSLAPARTITVSAQGMTTATPDEGVIDFSVVTQGQNPQTLSDNNNTKIGSVMQFLSSQGIASSDIATTGYDLEPNYSYSNGPALLPSGPQTITGYTLTQTVEVKIRDLTKVAGVLGGLAPLGVNQVGGVNFTFQNPDKFVDIARGIALTNAETEASEMAAQAGASLGEVVTVTESSNVPGPLPMYAAMGATSAEAMPATTPSLAPGTQDVTDNVTVTYALN